jgi:hypothetical protein
MGIGELLVASGEMLEEGIIPFQDTECRFTWYKDASRGKFVPLPDEVVEQMKVEDDVRKMRDKVRLREMENLDALYCRK